ncbi:hypothetical protein Poli38472_013375 [Pythium oligandrum]|uniref:Uncharacterized protein n=1 Tax=Pythium oligandrum TaxID=41045 RepID=A0A8K1FD35_PYTOL|nr:hypothetical protein Poli38472_013375 [Pythium oligandrum]|eukprot:TMW57901.1 hypothetical protein Poli38472_013375 [Pythium oligandrum]
METATAAHDAELPLLAPVMAPMTKEEQKERQRLHVRRTYYRKLNLLQSLRDQVSQLEDEYAELLNQKHLQEAYALLADASEPNSRDQLSSQLVELLEVKDQLRERNDAMQAALAEYKQFAVKMERIMKREEIVDDESSSDELATRQDFASRQPTIVIPTLRKSIQPSFCREIAQRTYAEMTIFRDSPHFLTTGVSVFGWRDRRLLDGDRVKFLLKKKFVGIGVHELALRGWNFLSSPKKFLTLYSPSMNPRIIPIQRVDDNNVVMLRVLSSPDGLTLVKFFFLISLFDIPEGQGIILRSLDQELLAPYTNPPGVQEQWADYYTWITFERRGDMDEHCLASFGGELHSSLAIGSDTWMLEVLFIALRWERNVVGPVFTLECQ